MMNYIIWKDIDSREIEGLLISELPPITKSKMRVSETHIDGVDGSVFEELGYETYDKTIKIGLRGNFNIDEIIDYFNGEGTIIFSNEPDKYYKAKIINQINYERLLRFRSAKIVLRTQPFKYSAEEIAKKYEAVNEVSGNTSVSLTNVIADNFNKISIFGKSTQGANPSPSNPQTITNITGTIQLTISNGTQTQNVSVNLGQNELCSIGNIKDELVIENGTTKIIKRIGKVVLDGSEDWTAGNRAGTHYSFVLRTDIVKLNTNNEIIAISNNFKGYIPNDVINYDNIGIATRPYTSGQGFYIRSDLTTSSETDFKAWLSTHNTTVYYELATPTEIDLGSITQPTTYAGTTNVSNNKSADMTAIGYKERLLAVTNQGNYKSKPLIKITGTGIIEYKQENITIFSYTFPSGDNYVEIDSDKQDAYVENTLKNRNMNGEFPILKIGKNNISWTGNITNIEYSNYSRWL